MAVLSADASEFADMARYLRRSGNLTTNPPLTVALTRAMARSARQTRDVARRANWGFTDRSGNLRRSIRARRPKINGNVVTVAVVAPIEPYSYIVENGFNRNFSYLRPARDLISDDHERRILDALRTQTIREATG